MKAAAFLVVTLTFSGCAYYNQAELNRFAKAQDEISKRYFLGDRAAAKKAAYDMIELETRIGKNLKLYHGSELDIALSYGRLAIIAEAEGNFSGALQLWDSAVGAWTKVEDADLPQRRSNKTGLPDRDEVIASIRKAISELERDRLPRWKTEKTANQTPEPTAPLVTIRADARLAPSGAVAHL